MAVSPHPSVKPAKPHKPPAVPPGHGESGQADVHYGAPHKLHVKSPNSSEMAHHFGKSGRPGDEKSNDEPG